VLPSFGHRHQRRAWGNHTDKKSRVKIFYRLTAIFFLA